MMDESADELMRMILSCACHYACRFAKDCKHEHHPICFEAFAERGQ